MFQNMCELQARIQDVHTTTWTSPGTHLLAQMLELDSYLQTLIRMQSTLVAAVAAYLAVQ